MQKLPELDVTLLQQVFDQNKNKVWMFGNMNRERATQANDILQTQLLLEIREWQLGIMAKLESVEKLVMLSPNLYGGINLSNGDLMITKEQIPVAELEKSFGLVKPVPADFKTTDGKYNPGAYNAALKKWREAGGIE